MNLTRCCNFILHYCIIIWVKFNAQHWQIYLLYSNISYLIFVQVLVPNNQFDLARGSKFYANLGIFMKINNWYEMYVSSSTAHYKSHLYNHWYLLLYVQDHSRNSMEHVNTNTLVNIPHCSVGNWSIGIPIVKGSILNVLAFRLINLKLIKYLCLTNRCFLSRITGLVLQ